MKALFLLIVLSSCAYETQKKVSFSSLGSPIYRIPEMRKAQYQEAVGLINTYVNSDDFWKYVVNKRKYFSHTDKKVYQVVSEVRSQLAKREVIEITFYTPWYPSNAFGGWNGRVIEENTQHVLPTLTLAGHILHETLHKYGWNHGGNKYNENDNVNSVPYAIGYDFEDWMKENKNQLATR